jgi:hypothetical protein
MNNEQATSRPTSPVPADDLNRQLTLACGASSDGGGPASAARRKSMGIPVLRTAIVRPAREVVPVKSPYCDVTSFIPLGGDRRFPETRYRGCERTATPVIAQFGQRRVSVHWSSATIGPA